MVPRAPTLDEQQLIASWALEARLLRQYYGRGIAALTWYVAEGLRTVAVDRHWRIYVDIEWMSSLPPLERATVLAAHEVEHLVRVHSRLHGLTEHTHLRRIAADMEINDDTVPGVEQLPPGGCHACEFGFPEGETAEDYLRRLLDDLVEIEVAGTCSGGSGAGVPLVGELGEPQQVGDSALSEQEGETLRDQIGQDILRHEADHPGSVPRGVLIWANTRVIRQHVDWRAVFAHTLRVALASTQGRRADYDRRRLSRRWLPGEPLRPGAARMQARIGVVVDTSASMNELGGEVLGVVLSLASRAGEIWIAQVDSELHATTRRVPREWRGGGGTDLCVGISALQGRVDVLVAVTDGLTPWPDAPTPVPLVVVLLGSGDAPSWASTVSANSR